MTGKIFVILLFLFPVLLVKAQDCSIIEKSMDLLYNDKEVESYLKSNIKMLSKKKFLDGQRKLIIDISPHFIFTSEERKKWSANNKEDTIRKRNFREIWNASYCIFVSKKSGVPWSLNNRNGHYSPLTFYFFRPIGLTVSVLLYFENGTDFKYKLYSMPTMGNAYLLTIRYDMNLNLLEYNLEERILL